MLNKNIDLSIKVGDTILYIRTAVIIKSNDAYILEKSDAGYAFLVGGKLKINELSQDGAKREVMEEIGFESKNLKLIKVIEHTFNNGKEDLHEICFVYLCEDIFDGVLPEKGFIKLKGEELASYNIKPQTIKDILIADYENAKQKI